MNVTDEERSRILSRAAFQDPDDEIATETVRKKKRMPIIRETVEPPLLESNDDNAVVEVGSLNVLNSNFESLDYDICENTLFLDEERKKGYKFIVKKSVARWMIFLLIGVLTALIGVSIDVSISELSKIKFAKLQNSLNVCMTDNCLCIPLFIFLAWNVIPVLIGSTLVTCIEPIAGGSGIPQVKCYLNGIKMPRIVRIKTLIVKIIGVITSVVGGLACGKEGPMIHSGAVVAAGISQGKSTTLRKDLGVFNYFREDHEKRDFVSGGAAAGVAAAFGAPVGGVLFSLEEGASFWNQSLTWRIFFASMVSTFTLNLILSAYHGHPGQLSFSGLLNFGKFESLNYDLFELAIFVMMGGIGGILGAVFNLFNYKLTVFRIRYVNTKVKKIMEAVIAAMVSTAVPMLMIYFINECKPLETDPTENPVQMFCGDGQYNTVAALWLQVPERSVRALLHDPPAALSFLSLGLFIMVYFLMAVWTFGLSVSGGLFIPSLLIGAAWGRFFSQILQFIFPGAGWIDPGKYALIGAAAQLGGIVRMTISLTIILIEATGDITFGLPLMITLITAKWTGDFFSEGIYDYHIQLSGVPLLAWEPPPLSGNIYANQVMSYPVVTFSVVETVGNIIDNLSNLTHNGFPVIDSQPLDEVAQSNKVRFICASYLCLGSMYSLK
ncbi:unnamed protein product [Bemisia tabaci]|uniref:H(+)/Cl(-) exchange transporter 7 n=1 Tax=Bemisia tabaci TaxID=7038 RepID=A0A9P0F5J8_BEMTA|nr:unnamed protein product [Bemisia tabaci]